MPVPALIYSVQARNISAVIYCTRYDGLPGALTVVPDLIASLREGSLAHRYPLYICLPVIHPSTTSRIDDRYNGRARRTLQPTGVCTRGLFSRRAARPRTSYSSTVTQLRPTSDIQREPYPAVLVMSAAFLLD